MTHSPNPTRLLHFLLSLTWTRSQVHLSLAFRKLTVVGITGVTFLDYKNKLFMQKDVRMRKYEMSGKSHGIWFILLFTTVEATLQIQSMELRLQRRFYNILQEFVDQYVVSVVSTAHDLAFVPLSRRSCSSMLSRSLQTLSTLEGSCSTTSRQLTMIWSSSLLDSSPIL